MFTIHSTLSFASMLKAILLHIYVPFSDIGGQREKVTVEIQSGEFVNLCAWLQKRRHGIIFILSITANLLIIVIAQ